MTVTTLIGDVVASRAHVDRKQLQQSLRTVLDEANSVLQPSQRLDVTVGDEFQGVFADEASAAKATVIIRLALLESEAAADSRYGLGLGEVTVFDSDRELVSQDGPGWWAARQAIQRARSLADDRVTAFVRTCFVDMRDGPQAELAHGQAMEAFLTCRDAMIDRMSSRQRRLLRGLLMDATQLELAAMEGVTQGAVSQQLHRSGAYAIEAAQSRLEGSAPP